VALDVIQPVWPLVLAAGVLAALMFLRVLARVRQEQVERYDTAREAAELRADYLARMRAKAPRAGKSTDSGYEVVG
jgi:hypothetical protein